MHAQEGPVRADAVRPAPLGLPALVEPQVVAPGSHLHAHTAGRLSCSHSHKGNVHCLYFLTGPPKAPAQARLQALLQTVLHTMLCMQLLQAAKLVHQQPAGQCSMQARVPGPTTVIVKMVAQHMFMANSTAGTAGLNQEHLRTSTIMLGPSHRARAINRAVDSVMEKHS